jgi:hypothetical protein
MTTASHTYIPRGAHQPRGKHPWCAACDTEVHLLIESEAITDGRTGILAVALHCSKCRMSRVFDTSAEYIATVPPRLASKPEDPVHRSEGYSTAAN